MTERIPLHVRSSCIATDAELYQHMSLALERGLPEIAEWGDVREGVIAIVGSAPSVKGQLLVLRQMQKAKTPILAVNDAHDWLISEGVVPDFALTVDPDAGVWERFSKKRQDVEYWIASQCHPAVFDHLADCRVKVWHPVITKTQTFPQRAALIGGGSTSGLRAISLAYVMGWRHFALFGMDSCLASQQQLRVDAIGPPIRNKDFTEITLPSGRRFVCNGAMAAQAEHFQYYYDTMPDARFYPYGDGLIQEIIRERMRQRRTLEAAADRPVDNTRVSFIHSGDPSVASYRYRAQIPARELGASLNDRTAGVLIFAKPQAHELMEMGRAKAAGATVIADFCDDHFDWMHYQEAIRLAHAVTCPTAAMAERIQQLGKTATVIPDPYEYPEVEPHVRWRARLLWFGHAVNRHSVERVAPLLQGYDLRIVSNFPGAIPWSKDTMLREFERADIVIIPATEDTKSANRAVEAIRQGCFVVAEPHPALNDIPGIYIGDIVEGIRWVQQHPHEANVRLSGAQKFLAEHYAPSILASAWKRLIQSLTTSAAAKTDGPAGSTSICAAPILTQTCATSP